MGLEALRIGLLAGGGVLAFLLAVAPRVACRRYARALTSGRDGRAGLWAWIAAGRGSR